MSAFYSLTEKILLEIDYTNIQFNNISHPLFLISDENDNSRILVNGGNDPMFIFNNSESTTYVKHKDKVSVVTMGSDTAYYYPYVDDAISKVTLPTSNIGLKYISVRLHIMAGYNFQDTNGFGIGIYVLSKNGKKIYLTKQMFRKGEVGRYSYSETAKNIADFYYDKYVEFRFIDYNDIITNGVNYGFFDGEIDFGTQPVIYAELLDIPNIDFTEGYERYTTITNISISFPTRDEYDLLTAHVEENENGYIEYCAKWDGNPIEDFIYRINSINGNRYYIVHELDIFAQHGQNLKLIDSINQIQTEKFDECKKLRPILPNTTNGNMVIKYVARLQNRTNGDSIIKDSSLSVSNIGNYLENIDKILIQQQEAPVKAFVKLVNNASDPVKEAERLVKIVSPIYINSVNATLGEEFSLNVDPFDNFFVLTIYQNIDGEVGLFQIEPQFKHSMVFVKPNGGKIVVDEVIDHSKRNYSKLSFKMDSSTAKTINANNIKEFYITARAGELETVLTYGTIS